MQAVPLDEEALSPGATRKRVTEFRLGRAAAHDAMTNLMPQPVKVRKAKGGEPIWPNHITGSITHTRYVAAAVLGSKNHIQSIGIDLEETRDHVNLQIAGQFSTEKEQQWIHAHDTDDTNDHTHAALKLKMLFSAKESLYKAIYQWKRKALGYKSMELTDEPGSNFFRVSIRDDAGITGLHGENGRVHYAFIDNYVFTYVIVNNQ